MTEREVLEGNLLGNDVFPNGLQSLELGGEGRTAACARKLDPADFTNGDFRSGSEMRIAKLAEGGVKECRFDHRVTDVHGDSDIGRVKFVVTGTNDTQTLAAGAMTAVQGGYRLPFKYGFLWPIRTGSRRGGSGKLNSRDKWIFRATAA